MQYCLGIKTCSCSFVNASQILKKLIIKSRDIYTSAQIFGVSNIKFLKEINAFIKQGFIKLVKAHAMQQCYFVLIKEFLEKKDCVFHRNT